MSTAVLSGRLRRVLSGLLVLPLLAFAGAPVAARPGEQLDRLEDAFRRAASRLELATVLVRPRGVGGAGGASSGVFVSADGLVLSDGDAGVAWRRVAGNDTPQKFHLDDVDVRFADARGEVRTVPGRVLSRDREADTSLIRLAGAGAYQLSWVPPGEEDGLEIGAFLFVGGIAFDENDSALPTITTGILAGMEAGGGGRAPRALYTTAAVNQGVNGGPVVDLDGHLVGTVSSWVDPDPDAPYQMLGKIVPVGRIRRAHAATGRASLPVYRARTRPEDDPGRALEVVIRHAASEASRATVSLEVVRDAPVSSIVPTAKEGTSLPRWQGPVTGTLVSADGAIVSSLYNFTNVAELVFPSWPAPDGASVADGLAAVRAVRAHLPGGVSGPARILGTSERWGLVLLQVSPDLVRQSRARPLEAAFASAYRPGRFAVALGDPFGRDDRGMPLVAFGLLSKQHAASTPAPWRGHWQTDASGLDVNAGGPVVGIDGRLLGMLQLWYPARHGRHSGVAFVVPWEAIETALPDLRRGIGPRRGLLGVTFRGGGAPRIDAVSAGSSADRAGLRPGDLIHEVSGQDVATVDDVIVGIGVRFEGESFEVTFERDGVLRRVTVTLGAR